MTKQIVINPEEGVPMPVARSRGRPKDEKLAALVQQFLAMPVGNSFFNEGAKRRDLEFLRRPVMALGANIKIVEVQQDEIYQDAGVRCWREHGLIDEL